MLEYYGGGGVVMDNIPGWLSDSLSKLGSAFSIDMALILAIILFFLSYKLFQLAITGVLHRHEAPEVGRIVVVILPGMLLGLGGIILITDLGSAVPMVIYVCLALGVGYGFAYLGYRLLDTSVLRTGSERSIWEDGSDLLIRALPGALFALVGVVIIVISLSQGFDVIREIKALGHDGQVKTLALMDTRLKEGLKLLDAHLRELRATTRP
jgi:hypothetical protein